MSVKRLFRPAVIGLCLMMVACGGKPAPKQAQSRVPVPGPETTATAVQPSATPPTVESARAKTPVANPPSVPESEALPDVVKKTFPTAGSVRSVSEPFPHRAISDSSGRVLGYEVFSDSAGVTERGYAGMVPLQVFLDAQAKPVRIYVLECFETPAYLDIVFRGGLLERLLAYDPAQPGSVDAVTLATSSSRAIIAGVTALAARVSNEVVGKHGQGSR